MDKQQAMEALRVIIAGSPDAFREASRTIQALHADSPIIQQRLNFVGNIALNDLQAEFTADDRALIASVMGIEGDSETTTISFKLTRAERAEVERLAQGEGYKDLSSYIRVKVGLIS